MTDRTTQKDLENGYDDIKIAKRDVPCFHCDDRATWYVHAHNGYAFCDECAKGPDIDELRFDKIVYKEDND